MILLILFAFIAGLVTILSPCILPVLPIVLSGSVDTGKKRPLGIVTGFILSFTFFTLLLSTIVKATGISADSLRTISIVVIGLFGFSMLVPAMQIWMEKLFSKIAGLLPKGSQDTSFIGGVIVGLSLGLLWAPCVGPILASVITLAATSSLNLAAFFITLAYSLGTALPLLGITYGGRTLLQKIPWLTRNTGTIQKTFGLLMIATAISMQANLDRTFQTYILEKFPNYGVGLTKFEDNPIVKNALQQLTKKPMDETKRGKPMSEVVKENYPLAPEFIAGGEWINSSPLTMASLKGRVVLVDFWTYTCINCIRTFPYLKSWHEKYKNQGLVIVGVHTPEFAFEQNPKNVEKAIKDFGIPYPVMQDNDYETWEAYDNHYWPAHYLIDKDGRIRHTHFGEGKYNETEKIIQTLLRETGATASSQINNPSYQVYSRTHETYLGFERLKGLISSQKITPNKTVSYTESSSVPPNTFTLGGTWMIGAQYAKPEKGATLTYAFDAKEVFLVMRPDKEGNAGGIKIYLDGVVVSDENKGIDVENGNVKINVDRLYKLINLPINGPHILKIEVLDGDIELYAFTFG